METLLFGSSFYYAAVEMETLALEIAAVDVATIAVYGSSFCFSSVAVAVATASAKNIKRRRYSVAFFSFVFFKISFVFFCIFFIFKIFCKAT